MKQSTLVALVSLLILFQSCKGEDPVLSPKIAQLIGTWQLVEPDSTYNVTLEFALDSANPPNDVTPFKAKGKSSVNAYDAFLSAAVDGLMFLVRLGSADMAGTPQATQFEKTYFESLRTVVRFEVTDKNRLRLFHGGTKPGILVYKRIN